VQLGSRNALPVTVISSGSISVDAALGVGGFPRGRVVEVFGPESSGKTTLALQVIAQAQAAGGVRPSWTPSMRWIPLTPQAGRGHR
jgi:recombination protein RecA